MAKLSEQLQEAKDLTQQIKDAAIAEKAEVAAKLDDFGAQISALEAKVTELGEPDPDIADLLSDMKANLDEVKGIVAAPVTETPTEPTAPVEDTPVTEEPAEPVEETPTEDEATDDEAPEENV